MENLVLNAEPPHAPECKVELSKIEEKVDSADDSFPKESENPKLDLQASITEPTTKYFQALSRKEKRNYIKKLRRKQIRQEAAEKERLEELARLQDAEEQLETLLQEKIEAELLEKERAEHEEQEKLFYERERAAQEEFEKRQAESLKKEEEKKANQDDENWRYVEDDGPPEIIWRGNEIIVRKKKIRVPVEHVEQLQAKNEDHATSNPLPPQSTAFAAHKHPPPSIPDVGEQNPTFGTEQDKTHCPFHIKTGVCRFGVRCSRVHVYPEQSFTLLMRNMYTGPGLSWDHDEGLEHSDEEVAQQYEEFYDDVHSEFLQYGELVNFKVCKNGSSHLRGNLYVHYQTEAGAQAAYNATNGRFYAGKQITCEFVGVTRWRVALCGEYMKGHHRPCSHGTACNFLHCFRNPRGEYDWADWDSPPPRYWSAKMAKLFGYKDDLREEDDYYHHDPHRRHRAAESSWTREGSPDRASRSKSRYSRHDEYDYSSRRREHRRHRSRDQHAQSSCDELENSSRHATRRRNQRQSPGTISERSRRRSPGDMYEKRKYKPERIQGLLTSQDMTPSMNSDDSELSDQDQRYKRDHDVEDSSADELQHPSTRTRKRYTRDFEYHNRGSSREPQHSPSRAHKSRREKYKDGSIEKEVTASPRDPEDETKAGKISRKGQVVERNESSSRQGSRKRSSRRKDLEDGSGDSEVDRFHRHPRSESKTSKRERKKRRRSDRHRDQMVESRFLEQEDRWNLDVDAQN